MIIWISSKSSLPDHRPPTADRRKLMSKLFFQQSRLSSQQALVLNVLLAIVTLIVLTSCQSQPAASADAGERHYFKETGYIVRGDFWHFFNAYGGVESLGYPLTEEMIVDGWTVQYFEKGRLERHPENEPAYTITVGWLGDLLQRRRPPIPIAAIPRADDPNRRYFPETGHTLSGAFLHYFETHGGS